MHFSPALNRTTDWERKHNRCIRAWPAAHHPTSGAASPAWHQAPGPDGLQGGCGNHVAVSVLRHSRTSLTDRSSKLQSYLAETCHHIPCAQILCYQRVESLPDFGPDTDRDMNGEPGVTACQGPYFTSLPTCQKDPQMMASPSPSTIYSATLQTPKHTSGCCLLTSAQHQPPSIPPNWYKTVDTAAPSGCRSRTSWIPDPMKPVLQHHL